MTRLSHALTASLAAALLAPCSGLRAESPPPLSQSTLSPSSNSAAPQSWDRRRQVEERSLCPRQALPPGFEALAPRPDHDVIAFAVAGDMVVPGRAWAVRLSRQGNAGPALVEVARLRRQRDCNRYDVAQQWQTNVSAEEFADVARRVAPLVLAGRSSTSDNPLMVPSEIAVDGTGVTLMLSNAGWKATRELVVSGPDGGAASAAFRAIIGRVVPRQDQPPEGW